MKIIRKASATRKTKETDIKITMNLDGSGIAKIDTGIGILDHLISQISKHGLIDIDLTTKGDLETGFHHTVEDTGALLGSTLKKCVGDGIGINRMSNVIIPLDETLVLVAIDISGRGYATIDLALSDFKINNLEGDLIRHFLEKFATSASICLHVRILSGINEHHQAEAAFKGLGKALKTALEIDPRQKNIPSTKGKLL